MPYVLGGFHLPKIKRSIKNAIFYTSVESCSLNVDMIIKERIDIITRKFIDKPSDSNEDSRLLRCYGCRSQRGGLGNLALGWIRSPPRARPSVTMQGAMNINTTKNIVYKTYSFRYADLHFRRSNPISVAAFKYLVDCGDARAKTIASARVNERIINKQSDVNSRRDKGKQKTSTLNKMKIRDSCDRNGEAQVIWRWAGSTPLPALGHRSQCRGL
jgi:hypothetical protein